jgi:hypothetical protein
VTTTPQLIPTGDPLADRALQCIVARCEAALPGRIRACYLEGSYADGTPVATSDLDLVLVFKDAFHGDDERALVERVRANCASLAPVELDVEVVDEAGLGGFAPPTLKLGSRLLYGDDIRDCLRLPPLEEWTRDRMYTSCWRIMKLFGRPEPVTLPIGYPDPDAEFFGYDCRLVRLPGGAQARSTRDLIRSTGWAATALIALRAGQYVSRKRDCHLMYRQYIGDEWSQLLADIYHSCRDVWRYLIPEDTAARAKLRAICQRTLGFENHFLAIYRGYLLAELQASDPADVRQALAALARISFQDGEILAAARTREREPG